MLCYSGSVKDAKAMTTPSKEETHDDALKCCDAAESGNKEARRAKIKGRYITMSNDVPFSLFVSEVQVIITKAG